MITLLAYNMKQISQMVMGKMLILGLRLSPRNNIKSKIYPAQDQ